jgi:hypothetical protein
MEGKKSLLTNGARAIDHLQGRKERREGEEETTST